MTVKLNTGKPVSNLDRLDRQPKPEVKDEKGTSQPRLTDQVKISAFAREASQAKEAGSAQDTQRAEKVAALKQQVAEGSYNPDSKDIAASLLKHIFKDR